MAVQVVLVAAGQFQDDFEVFLLLPQFGGQRIERRVVRFGQQQHAGELVIAGMKQVAQIVRPRRHHHVIIVRAEQFGRFVQNFARLADQQEAAARRAGAPGLLHQAGRLGKIGLGQPQLKTGAGAFLGKDGNGALVFFHGNARIVEAQAGAFGFGGEEGIENGGQMALFDAGAAVLDGQADAGQTRQGSLDVFQGRQGFVPRGAQGQAPPLRHGVRRVEHQIDDRLPEFHHVQVNRKLRRRQLRVEQDAAGQDFGDQLNQVVGNVIEIMVIALARLAQVQVDHALHQLAGLQRTFLDQRQALVKRMRRFERAQKRFAQRMNARDDVGEIVRHAQRQHRQRLLPRGRREPFFGDGLPGHVQPHHLVAEQQPAARNRRLAMLQNVGHPARDGVADAKSIGDSGAGLDGPFELLLQFRRVRFMHQVPETPPLARPIGGVHAGQFLDVGAGKLSRERLPIVSQKESPSRLSAGFSSQMQSGSLTVSIRPSASRVAAPPSSQQRGRKDSGDLPGAGASATGMKLWGSVCTAQSIQSAIMLRDRPRNTIRKCARP